MSESILGGSWYEVSDVARALEIPIEQDKRIPISHYGGPTRPAISGYTLMQIAKARGLR